MDLTPAIAPITTPSGKISKTFIYVFIGAVIILIVFLALKAKAAKKAKTNPLIPDPKNPVVKPKPGTINPGKVILDQLPNGTFPIIKGQKSKLVYMLQYSLNKVKGTQLVLDGDFGPLTLDALKNSYNITQVSSNKALEIFISMTQTNNIDSYIVAAMNSLNIG